MRHYSLNAIEKMPNLYDYLYPDGKKFYPERLVVEFGLYEALLIDVSDIPVSFVEIPSSDLSPTSVRKITAAEVSKDVKTLHDFLGYDKSICIPCPECEKEMAFLPIKLESDSKVEFSDNQNNLSETHRHSILQSCYPKYAFMKNSMELSQGNQKKIDLEKGKKMCIDGIIANASEITRCFRCSLIPDHILCLYFNIHSAMKVCRKPIELREFEDRQRNNPTVQMTEKEKEIADRYDKLKYVLILEKVGQEPSMADLQMFDIEKYKPILPKERFRDFSMALGLYASGVGCGSLLYLRRVFESIVITAQLECEKCSEWDKKLYESKQFNEKIDYLESLGRKIIPDELSDVKTKIYGFLSKGVHELSEQEAMELFPHLKLAIELILDEQISQKERNEKIKALKNTLNKKI